MSGGVFCSVGGLLTPAGVGNFTMAFSTIATISAATGKQAVIGQINWIGGGTKDLRKIHWRSGTITNGTGTTIVGIAVEDVVANASNVGVPDNIIDQSVTFDITTLSSDTWYSHTLTSDRTNVTQGSRIAVVFYLDTVGTGPSFSFTGFGAGYYSNNNTNRAMDYLASSSDGGTSYTTIGTRPCIAFEASDGTFGYFTGMPVLNAANSHAFSSISDPVAHGLYFVAPFNFDGVGIRPTFTPSALGNFDVEVYENGSLISSTSFIGTKFASSTAQVADNLLFDTVVSFTKGRTYHVLIKATGSGNVTLYSWDVNTVGLMDCLPGKSGFQYATMSSGGVLSAPTATRRPVMELLIGSITATSGSSSGKGIMSMEFLNPLTNTDFPTRSASYTDTAGSTLAWNPGPEGVLVWSDQPCYVAVGVGVVAAATHTPIPANTPVPFKVPLNTSAPWRVSALQISTAGTVYAKPINSK